MQPDENIERGNRHADTYHDLPERSYAEGGLLPGAGQLVRNDTGRPIAVFTAEQWARIRDLFGRG